MLSVDFVIIDNDLSRGCNIDDDLFIIGISGLNDIDESLVDFVSLFTFGLFNIFSLFNILIQN